MVCSNIRPGGIYNDTGHQCGFKATGTDDQNTLEKAAAACATAGHTVAGAENGMGTEIWCGDTLSPNCPKLDGYNRSKQCPGNKSEKCGDSWVLQTVAMDCKKTMPPAPTQVGLSVKWKSSRAGSCHRCR